MPQPKVSEKALAQRILYRDNFPTFAKDCLTIRPKEGGSCPLVLNKAQLYIHRRMEAQRKETGKVRAVIVKGRQQGSSTYVEARYYWKCIHRHGVKAFILAHEKKSTKALYEMAQRYHEHCPPALRPSTGTSNAQELIFDKLDTGYSLGTAGNDTVGRGDTIQLFHGSEVAFWPQRSANELTKGVMEAVPDMDDTEIVLESTGNGVGNYYHQQALSALRGDSEYILIFVPWYWTDEYTKPIPIDFKATDEEAQLLKEHAADGLKTEHLVWRRNKIISLTTGTVDGATAFRQEYPFTVIEAFQFSGTGGAIKAELVQKARKTVVKSGTKLVVGVDPSRGGDRFAVIRRKGRKMYNPEAHVGEIKLGRAVQICKKVLDEEKPARMFIDAGGGADLVDRLEELGYGNIVRAVAFGGSPLNPEKYRNKRVEMWGDMADWLADENLDVDIPDSDDLQSDLCSPLFKPRDSMDRILMESKDEMKARGVPSPDLGDAAALTFAETVIDDEAYMVDTWTMPASAFE